MTEPRTKAGQRLLLEANADTELVYRQDSLVKMIRAIESEADEIAYRLQRDGYDPPLRQTGHDWQQTCQCGEAVQCVDCRAAWVVGFGPEPPHGHGITDPTAPVGWQCGDAGCPQHGLNAYRGGAK